MKNIFLLLIFISIIIFLSANLFSQEFQKLSQSGIDLEVSPLKSGIEGWADFKVKGKNTNKSEKSVAGVIKLFTSDNKPAGEGIVYLEMESGETKEDTFYCQLTNPQTQYTAWKFEVTDIYDFILGKDENKTKDSTMTEDISSKIIGYWMKKDSTEMRGWSWNFKQDGTVVIVENIGAEARLPQEYTGKYTVNGNIVNIDVQFSALPKSFNYNNDILTDATGNYVLVRNN